MAEKNTKKKVYAPITNPQLDAAIAELKKGNGDEQQKALNEALKSAKLLSPCDFDVDIRVFDTCLRNRQSNKVINTGISCIFYCQFLCIYM